MLLTDAPAAVYEAARGSITGLSLRFTVQLAGNKVVAVHVSPGVQLSKDAAQNFWRAFDSLINKHGSGQ